MAAAAGNGAPAATQEGNELTSETRCEERKNAIDNLERLYTIVAGLALTTALDRLIREIPELPERHITLSSITVGYSSLLMFVALVVTIVPFYHGANRYLYATAVLNVDRVHKPFAALVDFVFFFLQALFLFAMARVLGDAHLFFWLLVSVLLLDCAWGLFVWSNNKGGFKEIQPWVFVNLSVSLLLVVLLLPPNSLSDFTLSFVACSIAVVRTIADYSLSWDFYWPGFADE